MSLDLVQVSLPSKCLSYEGVKPEDIRLRPFRGKDEELLMTLGYSNSKKKLIELLKHILVGIEPEKLTIGDTDYILLWEAINSYTRDYNVKFKCPNCLQNIDLTIDLGKIDSVELPDTFKQPCEIELQNSKINLRMLTIKDSMDIDNWAKNGKDTYLYSYALSIIDSTLNIIDKIKILEEMNTDDLKKIKKFHNSCQHGPNYNIKYTCPLCEEEGEVFVPFRLDEFVANELNT